MSFLTCYRVEKYVNVSNVIERMFMVQLSSLDYITQGFNLCTLCWILAQIPDMYQSTFATLTVQILLNILIPY